MDYGERVAMETVSIDVSSTELFPDVPRADWIAKPRAFLSSRFSYNPALAYAYVERLLFADDQDLAVASAKSILEAKLKVLEQVGFDKLAVCPCSAFVPSSLT